MNNQNESHNQGINIAVQSLNVLAQCAVGVFTIIGTITVALAGVGIEKRKFIYLILSLIVDVMSIYFHRLFKKWASPYVFQLMLCDDNYNYYSSFGLKVLSCYLFDIYNWDELKNWTKNTFDKNIKKEGKFSYTTIKDFNKNVKRMKQEKKYKKRGHIGVLTALWISVIMQVLFLGICIFILGWECM